MTKAEITRTALNIIGTLAVAFASFVWLQVDRKLTRLETITAVNSKTLDRICIQLDIDQNGKGVGGGNVRLTFV